MPALLNADQDLLQKLLLGQLPTAEVERLATEYADDGRLAELAESLAGKDDALLTLLHNHETAVVDPEGERLVERLLERLKPALPAKPRDDTAAMKLANASTEPSSPDVTGKPQKLPERLEHYRPIMVLGQGGMGTVYLAEDTRLGREVAIKTLRPELAANPEAKARFLREARSAAKLEHDHVIPIYSVGEASDGTPFLAMPLLKGEPLDALIRRTAGPLPAAMVVRLAREMASGLAAAHARGLIHRDIKPANIWLEAPTGRVKILDFGLAKAADASSDAELETHLTASGAIVGTPAYMAPEQASGNPVDGRADLFSLGCVLYELLAGKRAFSGPTMMSILMGLANHTPPAPNVLSPQCPAALSQLVMQLLEKDPAKRPASAEAVIQALSELDIESVQASRAASAPGPSQDATTVRGLTPSGSPTDLLHPSDSLLTMPASAVLPVRKRAIPKQRVALAVGGVLLMLLAAVVYRIQTDKGTLIVEINDDAVEAKLKTSGLEVLDSTSGRKFSIQLRGPHREASGDFKLVDGHGLKLVVLDADDLEVTTNEFKLVRDGKVRVRVTAEKNDVASTTSPQTLATNPDRRAAEWVLSIGGYVETQKDNHDSGVRAAKDLPPGVFSVYRIDLPPTANNADLMRLQGLANLSTLGLNCPQISGVGLEQLQTLPKLNYLNLNTSKVSGKEWRHLKNFPQLETLSIQATSVGDDGMAHLKSLTSLRHLHLGWTDVGDAELAHLKTRTDLESLWLPGTQVGDIGLKHLFGLTGLRLLELDRTKATADGVKSLAAALPGCKIKWDGGVIEPRLTDPDRQAAEWMLSVGGVGRFRIVGEAQDHDFASVKDLPSKTFTVTSVYFPVKSSVTDAGMKQLDALADVESVGFPGTQIGDVGIGFLKNNKKLGEGNFTNSKVTGEGLVHLKGSRVRYLELTGLKISGAGCQALGEMPTLRSLIVANTDINDADIQHLAKLKNLNWLTLHGTQLNELGIQNLAEMKSLGTLTLPSTTTDQCLVHIAGLTNLAALDVVESLVTDEGLIHFKGLTNLERLGLGNAKITGKGLVHLKGLSKLKVLVLSNAPLEDRGLEHLKTMTGLKQLFLGNSKLTPVGVAELQKALPECKIEWDGGVIKPKDSTDLK